MYALFLFLSLSVSPLHSRYRTERNGTARMQTQPHVISLYGAAVGTEDLMLVMEYAQNGISLSLMPCDQDGD